MCGFFFFQIELNTLFQWREKGCLLQKSYLSFTVTLSILKKTVRILLPGLCVVYQPLYRDGAQAEGKILGGCFKTMFKIPSDEGAFQPLKMLTYPSSPLFFS